MEAEEAEAEAEVEVEVGAQGWQAYWAVNHSSIQDVQRTTVALAFPLPLTTGAAAPPAPAALSSAAARSSSSSERTRGLSE